VFNWARKLWNKRIIARSQITQKQWDHAIGQLELLNRLSSEEKSALQDLATLFVYKKTFVGAHGLKVTKNILLTIALQACLPILKLDIQWYKNWITIVIYPDAFTPKETLVDENGIVHPVRDAMIGQAWLHGPVLLSWPDVKKSGQLDGYNLVLHEFAHKLDMLNGAANGMPPLHKNMDRAKWTQSFSDAYNDFRHKVTNNSATEIDVYAATDPAEFFAVLSELYFEDAKNLNKLYPQVYEQMQLFYRQKTL